MRVLVSVDLEGVAGVVDAEDLKAGTASRQTARRLIVEETDAAIRGALTADPEAEIVVCDAHTDGRNLAPELLDPRAALINGSPRRLGMLVGIDRATEAVVLVGHHARAGTVVFTHGSHGGAAAAEAVDYGAVANTLSALAGRPVRVALMTAIGVTVRGTGYDWKRRGERLVRASGNVYTIVRPGWFDYNEPDQQQLQFLQGDTRRAGDPSDGVIARQQIAQVLVEALTSPDAEFKTLELVAETGPAQTDLAPLFAALRPDAAGALDGIDDPDNQPLDDEPAPVRNRLAETTNQQ